MLVSEKWLRQWVNPAKDTNELAELLTMAGLEVDGIECVAKAFSGVVVGEVLSTEPHPDADKLTLCKVDVAGDAPLDIVCGAKNVRPGIKVPTATVGGVIGEDFKIKKAKLRGAPSFGMLCSGEELGIQEQSSGLYELPQDAPVGRCFREYMQLDDAVIDIDLTPNRADCFSVRGIAREVGVLTQTDLTPPDIASITATLDDKIGIDLTAEKACSRYVGRVLRNVDVGRNSPLWLTEALRRCGIRSINPVVDVTNYVLLALGQPMHGFDLNKVSGDVRVRLAQDGEKLVLLDESEVALAEDVLVIADQDGPLAMAGIMGGLDSGVTQQSTSILLESAYFDPIAIAGRARRFGLHTDSSQRFERGVDPGLQADAIELATRLILDICGGDCGPVMDIRSPNHIDARKPIRLRQKMIERVLGFSLEESKVVDILQRLGMKLDKNEEGWSVTPPSHRFDMEIEVDLIEELARVYGYNNIQTRAPEAEIHLNPVTENITPLERIQSLLVARDYQEAITYSFVDPKWQNALEPDTKPYPLSNPISADLSVMRTSIWAGLLKCVHYNLNRQQSRVRLFETGLTFVPENGGIKQQPKLAGVACGNRSDIHWSIDNKTSVDFYDVKGDLEALLIAGNPQRQVGFEIGQHSALHPGQTAKIVVDGNTVGLLGAIHPKVAQDLDVPKSTYLFEIELSAVVEAELPNYQPFSRFPANKRDLAFVVDENTLVGDMVSAIRAINSEILQEVAVFDVYTGQGVEKGQKSVAFTLTIQHPSTTLTDEEMSDLIESIVSSVTTQFSARLRE